MKYTLSCGDAMPGCSARFEEDSRERILELVAVHARDEHGLFATHESRQLGGHRIQQPRALRRRGRASDIRAKRACTRRRPGRAARARCRA